MVSTHFDFAILLTIISVSSWITLIVGWLRKRIFFPNGRGVERIEPLTSPLGFYLLSSIFLIGCILSGITVVVITAYSIRGMDMPSVPNWLRLLLLVWIALTHLVLLLGQLFAFAEKQK